MSVLITGLLMVFAFYAVFLLICIGVVLLLPASFLGEPARAVLAWLPPFMGGEALRNWAAANAERLAQQHLAGTRTGKTPILLAKEIEEGAMQAMLPLAKPAQLDRVLACPETGQGMVGVTAPEALAICDYLRKNKSPAEVERIRAMALENVKAIASGAQGERAEPPLPCPLQGEGHVCSVYSTRPLRCRPLHAIAIARTMGDHDAPRAASQGRVAEENRHEQTVAEGIELGLTRALKSRGLDAEVYELNCALATALEMPDAAARWARGETVFQAPLPTHWSPGSGSGSPPVPGA